MNYAKFLFEAAIDVWFKKNKELSQDEKLKAEIIFNDLQSKYTEHLHQKAKNLVVLNFQTLNLLYSAILESIKQNLSPTTVQWLTKEVVDGKAISLENIMEDYIPPLRVYQNNKEKLPDLNTIPDITSLNNILNENLEPEQKQLVNESDLGKIAEMDGWTLYMPHTTAASCELGTTGGKRDTTWCTTRTDGQKNLYLQYVGRFDKSYTLFYVIKRGVNASKNLFAKMSIGTSGNKILFNQGDNSVSVNADNKNLTEEKFKQVVGNKIADFFLEKIREIIGDPKFKHPMKAEMERLARDPKLFLKKLNTYGNSADDQESKRDLIQEILKYDNVHPEILMLLAEDKDERVREAVARNPNTPLEILRLFAKNENKFVREAVAKNPKTPPEILMLLAEDKDNRVRGGVIYNPNTPPEILMLFAKDTDYTIRRAVPKNPNTPPEIIILLAKDDDESVRGAVARNQKTPPEILRLLAKDKDEDVRVAVADNRSTPPEILMLLTEDDSYLIRLRVAQNPKTPPEILMLLAEDKDNMVRGAVAENPNAPLEILRLLAKDTDSGVRFKLTHNTKTPLEILMLLTEDDNYRIRLRVAQNPNTPPEILRLLAKDYDEDIRVDVAKNPNTPPEALLLLAKDENSNVRKTVANNQKTPPEALRLLAKDEDYYVRGGVAENPNTPPEIAQKLKTQLGLNESRKPIKISLSSIIFKN